VAAYFAIITSPAIADETTLPMDGSQLVNKTVCEIETTYSARGAYVPFAKDPGYLEFGSVTDRTGATYVLVVKHESPDRCTWRVAAALRIGFASDDDPKKSHRELVVSFNCAPVDTPYRNDVGYLGLIDPERRLEYVRPRKAWSVNVSSMKISERSTAKIYCPNFFGD
jgi:hypothetical protein